MQLSPKLLLCTLAALSFPTAIQANLNGTTTLTSGTSLNLDTGASASSGGDILWSGSALTPQNKATAFNIGALGAAGFGALTQSTLSVLPGYSATPIPSATLAVNDVFAVKTNGGNYAAVLVTANSGGSLGLQYTTFGVNAAPAGPTITSVLNNYSYIPAGFTNSGIAPGSLFVIIGSKLADPAAQAVLQSSGGSGLPTTLNGASVKVTVNGTTVVPAFYYAIAGALALVMPSNTPTGTGQVTVSYNNQTSSPYTIQVAASAMGFDSYYGTGGGLGVATSLTTGAPYNYGNSIPPGTTVTLWGSGLGADPARDTTYTPAAFAINNLAHLYIGGVDAPILYQGASGFPGVNQINVTIPASTPTGCNVPLVGVTAAGVPSNFVTLPIGTGACSDPSLGVAGSQFQSLAGQTTLKTGFLGLYHAVSPSGTGTQTNDFAAASFQSTTGSSYASGSGLVSPGGCISSVSTASGSAGTTTGLSAGALTVTNPAGTLASLTANPAAAGSFYALLPAGFISSAGGSFAFKGAGGSDVGAFNASVVYPSPLLSWTNQSSAATVARSGSLSVTWSGGAPGTVVLITGSSSSANASAFGSFTCIAPVSATQFTVPAYVLNTLPAGNGSVSVANQTTYSSFTATGLDLGIAQGVVSYQVNSTFN